MALTSGDYADALKINYLPPLNDQVHHAHVMLNRLEKNSEDVDGLYAYVPLITGRNPGVGSRGATGLGAEAASGAGPKLPAAGKMSYGKLTFRMMYHYGRGSVTGPSMRASKSNEGAFEKAVDIEMKGLSESLPDQLNNMVWSYGHGRYATLSGTTASTSVTFNCDAASHFRLKVGDRVNLAVISAGTILGAANGGATVSSITLDSAAGIHQVVVSQAFSAGAEVSSAIHAIYQGADPGTAITTADVSRANEMYGIPGLVDDGAVGADEGVAAAAGEFAVAATTLGGVNRATNQLLQSINLTNPNGAGTNRPLTYGIMHQAHLRATDTEGASEASMEIYTNPSLWATLGLLNIGNRTFNDSMKRVDPGFSALDFNGSPVFRDRDAPRDIMWFLDMSTLMLLTQTGYEFLDDDGGVLRNVSGFDSWEFSLVRDVQMGIRNFRKNVILNDLTAAVTIEGTNY